MNIVFIIFACIACLLFAWVIVKSLMREERGITYIAVPATIVALALIVSANVRMSKLSQKIARLETEKKTTDVKPKLSKLHYHKDKELVWNPEDLHSCPRCGGKAEVQYSTKLGDPYYSTEGFAESFVICTNANCGATTEIYSALTPADAMIQAMLAWNNKIGIKSLPEGFYEEEEEDDSPDYLDTQDVPAEEEITPTSTPTIIE